LRAVIRDATRLVWYVRRMSETLVLEPLRHIRGRVDAMHDQLRDLTLRVGAVEVAIAGLRRDDASIAEAVAHLGARVDRLSDRVERVERRLDLV
jgi:hypothetical protein